MSVKTTSSFTSESLYRAKGASQEHIMMEEQHTSPDQKLTARTLSWKRDQTNGDPSTANDVVRSPDEIEAAPEEKKKHNWIEPTASQGFRAIVRSSWLNVLLVFIPVGIASHFMTDKGSWPATIPFIFNFIAIIPLAKLLGFATEDLSLRVGEVCPH
jgi:Ca2+:H+ antiporter